MFAEVLNSFSFLTFQLNYYFLYEGSCFLMQRHFKVDLDIFIQLCRLNKQIIET